MDSTFINVGGQGEGMVVGSRPDVELTFSCWVLPLR